MWFEPIATDHYTYTMTQLNSILYEAPPGPIRNALVEFLKDKNPDKLIFPGPGKFSVPYAIAAKTKLAPQKFVCSSTNLFSSVIGYYLSNPDLLSALNINSEYDFIDQDAAPEEFAAQVLYGIKLSQAKEDTYYAAELKRALLYKPQAHIAKIQEGLRRLKKKLNGIEFNSKPLTEQIATWKNRGAFIFIDPAFYDLAKKVDTGTKITWNQPQVEVYPKTQWKEIYSDLTGAKILAAVLKNKEKDGIPETWHTLHLSADSKLRKTWLFLNWQRSESYINRPAFNKNKPLPYPIINRDDEITENSKITVKEIDLDVANYYRDLFTHKLGASLAECNVLFLIDGKIVAVRGFTAPAQAKSGQINEIYGIVHNNTRYKHLGRLIMRIITSREFERTINKTLFELKEITSTKLSKHKEYREAKNILTEYEQIQEKDGTYKTKYMAEFKDTTFKECLKEWLKEEASYEQQPKRKQPKIRTAAGISR